MKTKLRDAARRLRIEGMSVRDIAKCLQVSRGSVSPWVRDIELTEAQVQVLKDKQRRYGAHYAGTQTNRAKFMERRALYQEVGRAKAREGSALHLAGCMLYWAEGAKRRNEIYFVNSDSNMHTLFIRFLRHELGVQNEAMTIHIHCHTSEADEMRRIEQFWLRLLDLPEICLRKTQTKIGSDTRKNILQNGVCGIRVSSTELVQHIYGAIQEYGGFDNPVWLF